MGMYDFNENMTTKNKKKVLINMFKHARKSFDMQIRQKERETELLWR